MRTTRRRRLTAVATAAGLGAATVGVALIGAPSAFAATGTGGVYLTCTANVQGNLVTAPHPMSITTTSVTPDPNAAHAAITTTGDVTYTLTGALQAGSAATNDFGLAGLTGGAEWTLSAITSSQNLAAKTGAGEFATFQYSSGDFTGGGYTPVGTSASRVGNAFSGGTASGPTFTTNGGPGGLGLIQFSAGFPKPASLAASANPFFVGASQIKGLSGITPIPNTPYFAQDAIVVAVGGAAPNEFAVVATASSGGTASGIVANSPVAGEPLVFAQAHQFTLTGQTLNPPGGWTGMPVGNGTATFTWAANQTASSVQVTSPLPITFNFDTGCTAGADPQVPSQNWGTVNLNAAPDPADQSGNVGSNTVNDICLSATTGDPGGITAYQFTSLTLPPLSTLTVNGSPAATNTSYPVPQAVSAPCTASQLHAVFTAPAGVGQATFVFQAADAAYPFGAGNTATGTVLLNIGTPPVNQQINQQIDPGALQLGCTTTYNGATGGPPWSAPPAVPPPAAPNLTCPVITMPTITLNGTQQVTTAAMQTLWASDNRGDPAGVWTLSSYMDVPTAANTSGVTIPIGCNTADFCNTQAGADLTLAQNHIAATNLALQNVICTQFGGNPNPVPGSYAGSVCQGGTYGVANPGFTIANATAPNAGGAFGFNGQFQLTIPANTASGLYVGVVVYLLA